MLMGTYPHIDTNRHINKNKIKFFKMYLYNYRRGFLEHESVVRIDIQDLSSLGGTQRGKQCPHLTADANMETPSAPSVMNIQERKTWKDYGLTARENKSKGVKELWC